jgi:hypothetical protein
VVASLTPIVTATDDAAIVTTQLSSVLAQQLSNDAVAVYDAHTQLLTKLTEFASTNGFPCMPAGSLCSVSMLYVAVDSFIEAVDDFYTYLNTTGLYRIKAAKNQNHKQLSTVFFFIPQLNISHKMIQALQFLHTPC